MSWSKVPTAVPGPTPKWDTPNCHCGHSIHEQHCVVVGCPCFVAPPACSVCLPHREHGRKSCFALGLRSPCPCGTPDVETREQFQQWILNGPEWRNR